MGEIIIVSGPGVLPSSQGLQESSNGGAKESAKNQVFRIFEISAKPTVLPFSPPRRSEVEVESTEEIICRVECVIEAGLDPDEEFAEASDYEEQEEKEELDDFSSDQKPAMEAGDFSEEEKKEKEQAPEKVHKKPSKALQKAQSILLQNF